MNKAWMTVMTRVDPILADKCDSRVWNAGEGLVYERHLRMQCNIIQWYTAMQCSITQCTAKHWNAGEGHSMSDTRNIIQ